MPLTFDQKQSVVSEVSAVAARAHSAVAVEYRGLKVADMDMIRLDARKEGVYLRVIKNTLAKRAIEGTDFECIRDGLSGPLLLAFSEEDPGAAPRLIQQYAKKHDKLVIRFAAYGGEMLEPSAVERMAKLPTRDEALAQLLGVMRAPIEKLVRTMAEPHAKLARTLAAVRDQKEAA